MAKLKTRKSASKRFKFTATGKCLYNHAGKRHILTKKNAKRRRRLGHQSVISPSDQKRIKQAMPYA